jgi:hypothetical protein
METVEKLTNDLESLTLAWKITFLYQNKNFNLQNMLLTLKQHITI